MTGESSREQADVRGLLARYASVLDRARTPEARPVVVSRLAVGTDRQLTEHVRRSLDALARRYRVRSALAADPDPEEAHDARRVDEFAASLPPVPSRWQRLWPIIVALLLAQALLSSFIPHLLLSLLTGGSDDPLAEARDETTALASGLTELTKLEIGSVGQITDLLLHSDVFVICLVFLFVCLAGYLTQRPLANGFLLSRSLLGSSGVLEHEQRVFTRLDATPPRPHRPEVIAGALLGVSVLLVGLSAFPGYVEGTLSPYAQGGDPTSDDPISGIVEVSHAPLLLVLAIAAGTLGAIRLGWLATRGERRVSRSRLAATGAIAAVLVGGLIVYGNNDHAPPAVEVDLPVGFSTIRDGQRTLDIELACDEDCVLADVRLGLTGDGSAAPPSRDVRFGSERELRRSSHPDLLNTWLGVQTQWSYRLELSQAQLVWFQSRITPGEVEDQYWGTLEFTVRDYGGNHSVAPIFISAN